MKLKVLGIIIALAVPLTMLLPALPVHAATFIPNLLMSDRIFDNVSSMNVTQIDSFLNQFPSSCISSNNGFSSPDIMGYSITSGSFIYGANVSAGKIIGHAAEAYGLNPQVLLATLQKEQSLVTGSVGCHPNVPDLNNTFLCYIDANHTNNPCTTGCPYNGGCLNIAAGYYCPGNCLASKEGFTTQVIWAAWVLRFSEQRSEGNVGWNVQKTTTVDSSGNSWVTSWNNSDDPPWHYSGFMTTGTFALYQGGPTAPYDGYASINNKTVSIHMDTGATAALYTYTPFESGNQNFVNIFTNWFGPTYGDLVSAPGGGVYKLEDVAGNVTKRGFPDGITFLSYGYKWSDIVTISDAALSQISLGADMPYNVHFRDNKFVMVSDGVYLVENGLKRPVPDGITLLSYGYTWSNVVTISATELSDIPLGAVVPYYVHYRDGKLVMVSGGGVYLVQNGQKRPFPDGATFLSYGYKWSDVLTISQVEWSLIPDGAVMTLKT